MLEADLAFSFRTFKSRIWFAVDGGTKRLATASAPVQSVGYGTVRVILWIAYGFPGSPLRGTAANLARTVNDAPPRKLYRGFIDRFIIALKRMEALRLGRTDEIDSLLRIPDQARLDTLLENGAGAMLVMPHCHASVLMVRGLAARYPTLMLMRGPANEARAKTQRPYYENVGADLLDVRTNSEIVVARAVLKALRQGKIVVGVVDRIGEAPSEQTPIDKSRDMIRTIAFGQPVGFAGWPARFAAKCKSPILPVMVEQTEEAITLHIGDAITAGEPIETTQAYVSALEAYCRQFPMDWGFVYDKQWSRVLNRDSVVQIQHLPEQEFHPIPETVAVIENAHSDH